MNYRKQNLLYVATLLLAALSCGSQAATVSYMMDQSNRLPDNVHYLTVTLSDDVEGQLDFWVSTESSLSALATDNYGIQSFAFNLIGDLLKPRRHHGREGDGYPGNEIARERRGFDDPEEHFGRGEGRYGVGKRGEGRHGEGSYCALDSLLTADSFILPEGWDVLFNKGKKVDGVREEFDVRLLGDADNRQDPLHFSILGLTLDDILGEFDAIVAGFEYIAGDCGEGEWEHECKPITRAGFYGNTLIEGTVVPLPGAVWLFGGGLLGIAGVLRRNARLA